jgi:glycosyltransferase involved in cell wall biosynthesis
MGITGADDMKTVSVAMAVYNGELFIREQLDSIIGQLESDDELIISYDESQDNTFVIAEEYASRYPQVRVVSDPGRGVFSNFENAIANCNGDIIFISDKDDIWFDGKISKIRKMFENSDADMIIHNGVHINAKGETISQDFFSTFNIKNGLIRNFLKPRYSGCCTAFNRRMKQLIIPIPRNVGAYDHWIGMIGEVYGKLDFIPDILIGHRLHGDNVTVSTRSLGVVLRSRLNLLIGLIKVRSKSKQNGKR